MLSELRSIIILTFFTGLICSDVCSETPNSPTYFKDIAPIFEEHCVTCHRPGEVAPMSLLGYSQIRPWAKSIKEQVVKKTMPPFHATGPIGQYKNDLRLTEDEITVISDWVDNNCPKGNSNDFTRTKDWSIEKWPGGEPDYIVKFPRHELKPSTNDPYVYLFALDEIPENYWVRGFAWHFDSRKYAHHAIAYELPEDAPSPPEFIYDGHKVGFPKRGGGAAAADYLPGALTRFLPEGSALKIPKGARIYAIFHYAPTEETVWDEPELGFYLADGNITKPFRRLDLITEEITIQPGDAHYEKIIKGTFQEDGYISDYHVHMHNRGKSATVNLHYPDGRDERIFFMPQFNFDWQRHYYLTEPKFVPKGTVAEFVAVWDNSADNPFNPDPTATVKYGVFTRNEMGNANLTYTPVSQMKIPLIVQNGIELDLAALKAYIEELTPNELTAFLPDLRPDQVEIVTKIWNSKNNPTKKP